MSDKLKILFVSSEVDPFVKTGGLADVAGSLPQQIKEMGHDIRVVMPEYSRIPDKYMDKSEHLLHFRTNIVWRNEYVGINRLDYNGVPVYFIDNKRYFDRETLYESRDRHLQFVFFARALLEMLPKLEFKPDIIHCNDWQTGPVSLLLKDNYQKFDFYRDIKTVYTIHNLQYQGKFDPEIVEDVLGVNPWHWHSGNIRQDGLVNYMKTGIMYGDLVTTVSETYAEEIKEPYFGEGLDYALRMRGDDLYGILNGISYEVFDPETDSDIYVNYNKKNLEGKYKNKIKLQAEMGLPEDKNIPVIGIISRLVEQKGIDLITAVFNEFMLSDIQFIMLGTGETEYENFFREKGVQYPNKVAANIKYDAGLAQKIYAGSDIFLMPSRYEPCGLGQLISMRYGTVPVVKETGGLNDTVDSYDVETAEGNGFSFASYNAHDMLYTIRRAIYYYYNKPEIWQKIIKRAMSQNFNWERSAAKYLKLYSKLVEKPLLKTGDTNKKSNEEGKEDNRININRASRRVLQELPGIGSTYAKRIVKYRKQNGGFKQKQDIKKVKGIGKNKYRNLKNKIRI